jgi:hypothetical protein
MRSISVREIRAALPQLEQLLAEEGEVVSPGTAGPSLACFPWQPRRISRPGRSYANKCDG